MRKPFDLEVEGRTLVGMVHLPPPPAPPSGWPVLLTCHGVNGSKIGPSRMFVELAETLEQQAMATLRFDYRGAGDSEGHSLDLSLGSAVADCRQVLARLASLHPLDTDAPALLGHSFGAAVASRLARELAHPRGVVLWSGPHDPATMQGPDLPARLQGVPFDAELIDWDGFLLGPAFIEEMASARPVDDLAAAAAPVLLVHGSGDEAVPVSQSEAARRELERAGIDVSLEVVEGADHSFASHAHIERVVAVTCDWLRRLA